MRVGDLMRMLARARVPLGFASGLLVIALARPTGITLIAGAVIALPGELLRIWAAGHLNKSREVTASGPYRWFAHPLYVGSSVMGLGLAVASGSLVVAAVIGVYLAMTISAAVRSEEAFLRQKFGERYAQYRRGTLSSIDPAATTRRFALKQAIANGEYRAVLGFVLAILALVLKALYNGAFWAAGTR